MRLKILCKSESLTNSIHDGEEQLNVYKASLINCWIGTFLCLKGVIQAKMISYNDASDTFKKSSDLLRSNLGFLNDSKLSNICKVNFVACTYNKCVLLYLKSEKQECIQILRKLTETITKDFIFIDDIVLHKIYLLKWYWNYNGDKVLANQAAKMAIELDKTIGEGKLLH